MNDAIHLQGIGKVRAKKAIEFKEGEFMAWNYGFESKVLAIIEETAHFITFAISGDIDDKEKAKSTYTRRLKKDRLVAVGMGRVCYV